MYGATDVAREAVRLSIGSELWLSNLDLQRVLYIAWRTCYVESGERLFGEPFEAWSMGPVVPSAYYEYWTWMASPIFISKGPGVRIDEGTSDLLMGRAS